MKYKAIFYTGDRAQTLEFYADDNAEADCHIRMVACDMDTDWKQDVMVMYRRHYAKSWHIARVPQPLQEQLSLFD